MLPTLAHLVAFTETTQLLVEFFVVKDHLKDSVLSLPASLTLIKLSNYAKGVVRRMHVDRRCSVLRSYKINDDVMMTLRFSPGTLCDRLS